jgi:alpha-methylacyl-CoA racemase
MNRDCWPSLRRKLEATFLMKDRAQWCDLLEHTDACFAPVLSMQEAVTHRHNEARRTFVEHAGIVQPAPAPRFSRTPAAIQCSSPANAENLREWLLPENLIEYLGARLVS